MNCPFCDGETSKISNCFGCGASSTSMENKTEKGKMETIYLSRRNLLGLLSKLDRKANGELTACTLIKRDSTHKEYPQSMSACAVVAVEDRDYYKDRNPGVMVPEDEVRVKKSTRPRVTWPWPIPKDTLSEEIPD